MEGCVRICLKIERSRRSSYKQATMGQYYYPIILDAEGNIVAWMNAHLYNEGLKLMEHSYIDSLFVNTFEYLLSQDGPYHKSRVVWAGDYADKENGQDNNLHELCDKADSKLIRPEHRSASLYPYIVNHTKMVYVDKRRLHTLHPLPLLTVEGNGRGGGDIYDAPPIVGSWSRDVISVEQNISGLGVLTEVVFDLPST
jgi:hypothetical protein